MPTRAKRVAGGGAREKSGGRSEGDVVVGGLGGGPAAGGAAFRPPRGGGGGGAEGEVLGEPWDAAAVLEDERDGVGLEEALLGAGGAEVLVEEERELALGERAQADAHGDALGERVVDGLGGAVAPGRLGGAGSRRRDARSDRGRGRDSRGRWTCRSRTRR